MTSKKQLKARVRARMAKTGESYTAARRHVAGVSPARGDAGWTFRGGRHPYSAAIDSVLAHHGVEAGEPLVFLAGGGLGAGYILWEFKHDDSRHLVLGFRNQWQYYDRWMAKTLDRLGVAFEAHRTAGAKGAAKRLAEELDAGHPCIVLPDRQVIGYWLLPPHLDGHGGHPVVAYRRDEADVLVDDRGQAPVRVPAERMDAARARVSSYKNVLHVLRPGEAGPGRLAEAALAGLRDCVEHLSVSSDSFSLPAWRKWSRMITDGGNAKGWPRVFADGRGLSGALLSMWEGVEPVGMDGGNLRDLFADALDQAAPLLGLPLGEPAAEFRHLHALWHDLAEAALPSDVPEFARMRELTAAIRESLLSEGTASPEDGRELWELRAVVDREPPVKDTGALFADLGERIAGLYRAETEAVARLRSLLPER
ncbi:BtrH N-terminal domain-containing protein [Sphaerisporangium sp. TRM90804]|uniref:BtrH N-terminal domain-containing protein n=1 Tax=Sphaerisporangium sp. TRM90804 TaxID=3031113 RepID=UPI0024470095|nr:BtrH N-terminal domain-containing protein [Sphaerisporangium sp. TRM90804]MDH2425838.1 BtrH N-terminal domain-containing protein [Sphaerisporangium sp. TRM90804]